MISQAIIDYGQQGQNRIVGVRMQLSGRINGAERSQKKVVVYGSQHQQITHSLIEYASETIETRYGTLGLKVQCAKKAKAQGGRRPFHPLKMSKINPEVE